MILATACRSYKFYGRGIFIMLSKKEKIILYVIGAVAFVLSLLCGAVFGPLFVIAASGYIYYKSKRFWLYPLLVLAGNGVYWIVNIIRFSNLPDINNSGADVFTEFILNLVLQMGEWLIGVVVLVVGLIACAWVFGLMILCNFIVKKKCGY